MFPCSGFYLLCTLFVCSALGAIQVSPPAAPPPDNIPVVYSNFLGVSLELSFINYYFGNTTDDVPQPVVDYLSALRVRSPGQPLRLRLGGNSMDSSTYDPNQQDMIKFTDPTANVNDQTVSFGPVLFDVMNSVNGSVGGVQYLVGLSLRDPNSTNVPLLAGDSEKALGDTLDAFLLGNEPDLYKSHGDRPNMANYSVNDYIGDYWVVFNNLQHTAQGDVLSQNNIAGPTICCFWDFAAVLTSGWLDQFKDHLKYITLQHYPQDICSGTYRYGLDYYLSHANTVSLAQWQSPGLQLLASAPPASRKPLIMDEFNSASCGGIPNISNTFGATLWTADYAFQMASVGYSAAYLHTRERGVTYNLFDPPDAVAGGPGAWTTNPSFYAMLPVTEALQASQGSKVADLNVQNSMHVTSASVAGYATYDASTSDIHRIVLFNFANSSGQATEFSLASSFFPSSSDNITVRYLTAPSVNEKTLIAWGNETYAGVSDGKPVQAPSSEWADQSLGCSGGCTVRVPGPGLAVIFVGGPPVITHTAGVTSSNSSAPGAGSNSTVNGAHPNGSTQLGSLGVWGPMTVPFILLWMALVL